MTTDETPTPPVQRERQPAHAVDPSDDFDEDEEMRRFNAMPDHPHGSVDPSDDFDEDEEAHSDLCGATGRPHRRVYSARRDEDVCGDCGAC